MPTLTEPTKEIRYVDLQEESRVSFDWSDKLNGLGATIATAEFVLSTGITKYHEGFDTLHATVWLEYDPAFKGPGTCTCRITTGETPPQRFDRTVTLKLKSF